MLHTKKRVVRERNGAKNVIGVIPKSAFGEFGKPESDGMGKTVIHRGRYNMDHHEEITAPYQNFCKAAEHVRNIKKIEKNKESV